VIEISRIEVLALKKLVLINHALSKSISGMAGIEQLKLTQVLNDITLRADLDNNTDSLKTAHRGDDK
jgi:hypothetical protein